MHKQAKTTFLHFASKCETIRCNYIKVFICKKASTHVNECSDPTHRTEPLTEGRLLHMNTPQTTNCFCDSFLISATDSRAFKRPEQPIRELSVADERQRLYRASNNGRPALQHTTVAALTAPVGPVCIGPKESRHQRRRRSSAVWSRCVCCCQSARQCVNVDSDVRRVLSRLALDQSVGAIAAGAVKTCYVSV